MRKILYIEDEKDLHALIVKMFPKDQYRIVCAQDGVEALMKCRNEEFDLIISDYRMPRMDGLKFYKQIREIEEKNKKLLTPVIFLTSFAGELRSMSKQWTKCEFLNKPFQVYELMQKVDTLLGANALNVSNNTKTESKLFLVTGDKLFEEGDKTDLMYYVVSGVLGAYKSSCSSEEIKIGQIFAGELLGELAVIDDSCHCLTIIAEEPCELIVIPAGKIATLVNSQPKWIKLMIDNMSKRLKQALKQIA